MLDNDTNDLRVTNKTDGRIQFDIIVEFTNNNGVRKTRTINQVLQPFTSKIRKVGSAVPNTICILDVIVRDLEEEIVENKNNEIIPLEMSTEIVTKEQLEQMDIVNDKESLLTKVAKKLKK